MKNDMKYENITAIAEIFKSGNVQAAEGNWSALESSDSNHQPFWGNLPL